MAGGTASRNGRSRRTSASRATPSASPRPSPDPANLMRRQIAARLAQSLVVIFIVTTISFFVIRSAPGDPFSYSGGRITPAIREQWRAQFGYDRPMLEQYVRYVTSVLHGKLGYSVGLHRPVAEVLADAVPRTLLLAGLALGLSFVLGMTIGALQAARRDSWFDRISSGVLLLFYSLPDFWGAIMILLLFSYWIPILPSGNIVDSVMHEYMNGWQAFWDRVRHLVLPVGSL